MLIKCARCNNLYLWQKSSSSLKMTFCSALCEGAELKFNINAFADGRFVFSKKTMKEAKDNKNLLSVSSEDEPLEEIDYDDEDGDLVLV